VEPRLSLAFFAFFAFFAFLRVFATAAGVRLVAAFAQR